MPYAVRTAEMLKILVIAASIPMPDRQAGMLRLFRLLEILNCRYELHFFTCNIAAQIVEFGFEVLGGYELTLRNLGINVHYGDQVEIHRLLRRHAFEFVLIEHYQFATPYLDAIRAVQPRAKIVIDSMDIAYERKLSKARATRKREDFAIARKEKAAELREYHRSDAVIAISDQDKETLSRADPSLRVEVIPLILPVPELGPLRDEESCNLIFVGNFEHTANGDAMTYFCREIFPAIKSEIPYAKLSIVGNAADKAVATLAEKDVVVLGFVPDLRAQYVASDISIAPLTWGAGLKGKVAEAMAYGLPVVATATAIEGFGLTPGKDVILGDTPSEFVSGVVRLHRDRALYEQIRANGWKFVESNFSGRAIEARIDTLLARLEAYPARRAALAKRIARRTSEMLSRHLLWRFHSR